MTEVNNRPIDYEARGLLPVYMIDGMKNYIEHRRPPGGFLGCILSNDLMGAAGKADDINRHKLFDYADWLHNYAPSGCFGSPEIVKQWLEGE